VPLEPVLLAEQVVEVRRGPVDGFAVDGVVRRHHRLDALVEDGLERREERVPKLVLGDVDGRGVLPALGLAVGGEVLRCRNDGVRVVEPVALVAPDLRGGHLGAQPRALAERLEDAPPARVAGDVARRGVVLVRAHATRLLGRHPRTGLDERRVPRRRGPESVREHGRPGDVRVPVDGVDVQQHRDAEFRLLRRDRLDALGRGDRLVDGLRVRTRPPEQCGDADVLFPDRSFGVLEVVHVAELPRPRADELPHLLRDGHPSEEVLDAFRYR
jgi:hypothetical protein